jgi:arylsulfatase A
MTTHADSTSSRRRFLKQLGLGAAALASANAWTQAEKKLNFVFVLVDDLGWADLPCYGNTFNEAPHIDRLAREGMRFTDAYAACPVCSPTRASILSGQYPARVGITDFITGHWRPYEKLRVPKNRTQYLPLEIPTMAEALQGAGYATATYGKWHLGSREHFPDKQGFDEMLVAGGGRHFGNKTMPPTDWKKEDYLAEKLTDAAVDFIRAHKEEPFFVYLSHYAVHIPLEAREKLVKKYEAKKKPATGVNNPVYAAMVEHVDDSVGRLLDTLDAEGLSDNTVVIFFSDNGGLYKRFDDQGTNKAATSNAPLRDEKGTLYEGGIREPLIVRWPGVTPAGSTCGAPVTSVDFYPTLLEMAGAAAPENHVLDGESLTPWLRRNGESSRDAIFWHYPHYHHSTPASAVRMGDWKLLEFFDDGHLELYNLRKDIGETTNLAAAYPERVAIMHARLKEWRKSAGAELPTKNPNHDPARAQEWGRHPDRPKPKPKPKQG